jgi:hypothetical protein
VNTIESTSFNGFLPNLVHTYSLGESGTLLIFKVKGQGHWVNFLGEGICHALRCPCCNGNNSMLNILKTPKDLQLSK